MVAPSFRPDKALNIDKAGWKEYIAKLAEVCGCEIKDSAALELSLIHIYMCIRDSLYAEVVRRGMVERLQAEFKVVIAGPTTMAALLNSLQMGFKTLAIQKRSSEVWEVLSSVKSEFETCGTALEQAQTRINQAGNALEETGELPRTILYSLNPADNQLLDTIIRCV